MGALIGILGPRSQRFFRKGDPFIGGSLRAQSRSGQLPNPTSRSHECPHTRVRTPNRTLVRRCCCGALVPSYLALSNGQPSQPSASPHASAPLSATPRAREATPRRDGTSPLTTSRRRDGRRP
eukprot:3052590-Prymnesium_polylepis.1